MKRKRIKRYARHYNRLSRKAKKRHPLVSKKDIKRNKDGLQYAKKMEIARELGLLDEVRKKGWSGLSSADTGRIGGHLSSKERRRRRMLLAMGEDDAENIEGWS